MAENTRLVRKAQRSSRLSTIISLSLVLFLLGILGVLLLHAHKISNYVKENIELSVMLNPDADSTMVSQLQTVITNSPYVKTTRFVSSIEAAEVLKKELGEDFVNFLGYNPLHPSLDVHLKAEYAEPLTIKSFIQLITANPVVTEVYYQQSLVDSINKNFRIITLVILSFSLLLLLICIALINNTIRIALYSKRLLIKSMLLVGATKGFIRKPFLTKGLMNGFYGGLIAIGLLAVVMYFAIQQIPELTLVRDYELIGIIAGSILVSGIVLSLICTLFAVNKYLRLRTDDLY